MFLPELIIRLTLFLDMAPLSARQLPVISNFCHRFDLETIRPSLGWRMGKWAVPYHTRVLICLGHQQLKSGD